VKTYMDNTYGYETARCENCGVEYAFDDLEGIDSLGQRISAGEDVPAGQCPDQDCGALCHAIMPGHCHDLGLTNPQMAAYVEAAKWHDHRDAEKPGLREILVANRLIVGVVLLAVVLSALGVC